MSQNNSKKPILIRDEAGVQTFRDPVTGEEFSTTMNKPIPGTDPDSRLATVRCKISDDQELATQIAKITSVVGPELGQGSRELLTGARESGRISIRGLRIWRAQEIATALRAIGFSANVLPE